MDHGPINTKGIMANLTNVKLWLHGLLAVFKSAFAASAAGVLVMPSVFSFTKLGFLNMIKLSAVPAMVNVCAYLKTSPVPDLEK